MSQIVRRPAANRDLVTIYQHYARHAGLRVADRFFAEAEATFTRLADMPGLGTRYEPSDCAIRRSTLLPSLTLSGLSRLLPPYTQRHRGVSRSAQRTRY